LFIRHYDVDVSSWTSVSGTSDDFWDGSSYHYYPSLAVNPWGDIGLVYTRSSTSEYASDHWTIKPQDDGAYVGDGVLKAGESYYGNSGDTPANAYRWGDYSGAAMDPVTGGLWFIHMYARGGTPCTVGIGCAETWIGYVNHTVFVDAGNPSSQTGSRTYPWKTFLSGYNSAWNENDLVLKAGSYNTGSGILSKPLMILSDGGTATLTP
jgi:hypothetical protein